MKPKIDYLFLSVLLLLIAEAIYSTIFNNIALYVTNYLGIAGWVIALILRLANNRFGRYAVGWLLILGALNVFNFFAGITWFNFGFSGLSLIQFNPLLFLLLVTWYSVNKAAIKKVYAKLFKDSQKESIDKHQKMVDFYLNKFNSLSTEEFEKIYANIGNYPDEAQQALIQLKNRQTVIN